VRLDHCVIAVSDWQRSNPFYRDVLGAEIVQRDEWFGFYLFDDWQLNVHGPGFEGLNARLPVQPGNSDLCFRWDGPIEGRSSISSGSECRSRPGPSRRSSPAAGSRASTSATRTAASSSSSRTTDRYPTENAG
jgi:catechol 2,3-dioxygenase-like lactoylglutathione lyase family enzyme